MIASPKFKNVRHISVFELRRRGLLDTDTLRPWVWHSKRDGKINRLIFLQGSASEIRLVFPHTGS